jgi:hypothetical protein
MSCIYCEKPCKTSKCNICDVKYHHKCYSKCYKNSHTFCQICVKCPKCNLRNINKDVQSTRFYSKHLSILLHCKHIFQHIENPINTDTRKLLLAQLFEYIITHKWFVHQHPSFNKLIHERLTEFAINNQWVNAYNYYYQIYDKQLIQN